MQAVFASVDSERSSSGSGSVSGHFEQRLLHPPLCLLAAMSHFLPAPQQHLSVLLAPQAVIGRSAVLAPPPLVQFAVVLRSHLLPGRTLAPL